MSISFQLKTTGTPAFIECVLLGIRYSALGNNGMNILGNAVVLRDPYRRNTSVHPTPGSLEEVNKVPDKAKTKR